MPITRSQSAGADDAANFEEVETSATSGSSEVRELRGQLAALTDLVTQQAEAARQQTEAARRQEARMKRLEDLLLQQAAALGRLRPLHRQHQLWTLHRERRAERDRLMERLNEFRRCSPRVFDGEKVDHWIVEKWLMHMEKLFRDTFVEERDRVWLATHHLDGEAYRWWLDFQDHPSTDLAAITWTRFKELLLAHYFPTSVKRKMEQDLRSLRQGDRTVAEYEREFSRLLHCVPFVVRDDEDKARIFERGLRPSTFREGPVPGRGDRSPKASPSGRGNFAFGNRSLSERPDLAKFRQFARGQRSGTGPCLARDRLPQGSSPAQPDGTGPSLPGTGPREANSAPVQILHCSSRGLFLNAL
uniref:Retrotransposon gag domain-containing protein n=1 Tax=Ananas comosus var. bracteatus TaxID=296719 RepID=A0A6V7PXK0_ANACO|nr:unnamed protein product [Ananas comosus var. bracteatus]